MDEKITAHPQKEEREKVLKEIRQLENRKKILENKQRNEERRVRTRRLIERGAILEGIFPLAPDLPGVEVKAFLIALEREEMTTRLYLIAALPVALAHATPTQARRVHAYYIAGIKQPEIARREGIHSSKVSVAIHRGLRNMRRCYDVLFQTE